MVIAIIPVSKQLDLKAVVSQFQAKKCALANAQDAQRATGYVTGGISPFGQKTSVPTLIDSSATDQETIYVSAGKRGIDIELSPADVLSLCNAKSVSIAQ